MDLSHWLWLATAAYAIHMIEEFMLDWRDWARVALGAALMATPIVLLRIKDRPYFRQA